MDVAGVDFSDRFGGLDEGAGGVDEEGGGHLEVESEAGLRSMEK
jgi:hypothetical protein